MTVNPSSSRRHTLRDRLRLCSLIRWNLVGISLPDPVGRARSLETMLTHTLESRSQTLSAERDLDSAMIDVED
jgi:hypothetical protein